MEPRVHKLTLPPPRPDSVHPPAMPSDVLAEKQRTAASLLFEVATDIAQVRRSYTTYLQKLRAAALIVSNDPEYAMALTPSYGPGILKCDPDHLPRLGVDGMEVVVNEHPVGFEDPLALRLSFSSGIPPFDIAPPDNFGTDRSVYFIQGHVLRSHIKHNIPFEHEVLEGLTREIPNLVCVDELAPGSDALHRAMSIIDYFAQRPEVSLGLLPGFFDGSLGPIGYAGAVAAMRKERQGLHVYDGFTNTSANDIGEALTVTLAPQVYRELEVAIQSCTAEDQPLSRGWVRQMILRLCRNDPNLDMDPAAIELLAAAHDEMCPPLPEKILSAPPARAFLAMLHQLRRTIVALGEAGLLLVIEDEGEDPHIRTDILDKFIDR